MNKMLSEATQPQELQTQETQTQVSKRKRLQLISLLDRIMADAERNSAAYVKNYDVGRGAE